MESSVKAFTNFRKKNVKNPLNYYSRFFIMIFDEIKLKKETAQKEKEIQNKKYYLETKYNSK